MMLSEIRAMAVIAALSILVSAAADKGPLRVYILAGQSNMQGQAHLRTLPHMAMDPVSKALHDKIVDENGEPRVYTDVSIAAFSNKGPWGGPKVAVDKHGPLTVGYGGNTTSSEVLGTELAFGITMQEHVKEPILIIKTSWGGKSLHADFRPPSAGVDPIDEAKAEKWRKEGTYDAEAAKHNEKSGHYYRLMMEHVRTVLADPGTYCPAYDPERGFEIAGFVWFQGYNDMVGPYPPVDPKKGRRSPKDYSEYSRLLACFIRDVRKELKTPAMPFVIGVIGIGGETEDGQSGFRVAMAAPAELPEFKGNVVAVHTARYWDDELVAAHGKAKKLGTIKDTAYRWTKDGAIDKEAIITPGWQPIGSPPPEERVWRYVSFQKEFDDQYRPLREGEPGDERAFREETPADHAGWYEPDFDDSRWKEGLAPIGKGDWTQRGAVTENRSEWGEGNILLMRTSFKLDTLDYEEFRLCVLASESYHVYLNDHKIHTYVWWRGDPEYRAFGLDAEEAGYLKKGTNVLAAYANVRDTGGKTRNSVDLVIEGLTKEGQAHLTGVYDGICSPEEREIAKGVSHQGYHYMGSSKIYSRIGEAFTRALIELEQKPKR